MSFTMKLRVHYSLRIMLLSFLVFACFLAWITQRVQTNAAQRRAVQRIWRLGGHVAFAAEPDYQRPVLDSEWKVELEKSWLDDAWLSRTPTAILFANQVGYPTYVTDRDVEEFIDAARQLPSVRLIRLDATHISQSGIIAIRTALPGCTVEKP